MRFKLPAPISPTANTPGRLVSSILAPSAAARTRSFEARLADGHTLQAHKILVAVGRHPQVENLGLAEIGVKFDPAGWVWVDGRYATTATGLFAAGDVIGPPGLAAVAMEQARVAICHAFGFEFKSEVALSAHRRRSLGPTRVDFDRFSEKAGNRGDWMVERSGFELPVPLIP